MENRRKRGAEKEELAASYLEAGGMRILERNFRNRRGEVDLIGWQDGCLVFVEVKYRSNLDKGSPQEAVGRTKQRRICEVADYYRLTRGISSSVSVRYDVVAILGEEISWYRNAFPHWYR